MGHGEERVNVILCKELWRWSHNLLLRPPVVIYTMTKRLGGKKDELFFVRTVSSCFITLPF